MKKCLIGMSGGVDSSVAARIMQERGYECIGCTMVLCGNEQTADARNMAEALGMEFHEFHAEEEFRRFVMGDFVRCYEEGQTPNPCIVCNRHLKFGVMLEKARELDCDTIVTGHYARIEKDEKSGRFLLKKAKDAEKDQSYMLYRLTQEQLARAVFPLGEMTKEQARKLAEEKKFINANKPDSQDICFVPDGDYAGFLGRFTGKNYPVGPFLGTDGRVFGEHKGIIHYTVGQRKGLGIAWEHPLYVLKICPEDNAVVLGKNEELFVRELVAGDVNLIAMEKIEGELRCKAKIRYRHQEQPCSVWQVGNRLKVRFDEPQRAVTPGQSVVLYDGDTVLGGGVIL